MFPLFDQSRSTRKKRKIPLITILLIIVNTFIFIISLPDLEKVIQRFGFLPQNFFNKEKILTVFSSMFLHGSFSHLIGNMWFLWVFGDNVEDRLGKIRFLFLYILSGVGALFFYLLTGYQKNLPLIGASGAISGVLGAYLLLFPKNRILALVPLFYFYRLVSIPSILYIGFWFFYQFLYMESNSLIAYAAHVGGFLTGIFLTKKFQKK